MIHYKALIRTGNRQNKSGVYSIRIRITLDRKSIYLNLKEEIEDLHWTGKNGEWVRHTSSKAFELNDLIKTELHDLWTFEKKLQRLGKTVTLDVIAKYFTQRKGRDRFNDYAAAYVQNLRGKQLNTLKIYKTFLKHLDAFNADILFADLNKDLFFRFAKWLSEKGLSGNSLHKYFKPFRQACRQATEDGLLERNPFENVNISDCIKPTSSRKRVFLTIDEISHLKRVDLSSWPELEEARKHWLFCFYAGFYYADLKRLRWSNVRSSDQGYYLSGDRYKNNNPFVAPVHRFENAITIIEQQKGIDPELVFPGLISEQKYNLRLKSLAAAAGITKNLMNKTARHSNIQFWESQGLATQHVAKMVGHTRESTTRQYYDLTSREINHHVSAFDFSKMDI